MGLAQHKQDNFFTHFPMYVCLGAYYVIRLILTPIILLWNSSSSALYDSVNASTVETGELKGAYLNQSEEEAAQEAVAEYAKKNLTRRREIKVKPKYIQAREALINAIESTEEVRSETPVSYRYVALSPFGRQVTGMFYGYSKTEVYTFLENEGYKVFSIETATNFQDMFAKRKIKASKLVFWLQQLSTYLKAGIPLTDAMRILSRQMGKNDKNIETVFNSIVYNLTLGESFSQALEEQDEAFPPLLINMVKSAEATGDLEGTLDEMADYYKSIETVRKEMISALTYPALVFVFAIAVIIFLMVYLVPQFVDIYETAGATLNPITEALIVVSEFLKSNLVIILIVIALTVALIITLYKNVKAFRYTFQIMLMHTPVVKNVIKYKEMAVFAKTFASLLRNNVFITDSMDILSKVTSNEIYKEIMQTTVNFITRGEKISEAFRDHWAVPEVAYYMMVTGEQTGELAEMMSNVADYFEEQHKTLVNSLKQFIEPILILTLAIVVGGIIIAVIVPMFGLYSEILNSQ